jgi:DNA-directed DNA polymerase III PolC
MYINTHSYYSLRYGTLSPENLISLAKKHQAGALALTDINTSMGIIDFVRLCKESNIKPVAGIEFRNKDTLLYIGIACNNEGFRELNDFLSAHNLAKKELPVDPPGFDHVIIIYPYGKKKIEELADNEFIGVRPAEVRKLYSSQYRHHQSRLVILQPVTFINRDGYMLHRHFRAIDHNILLSQLLPEQVADTNETFIPPDTLVSYYKDYPGIIMTTEKLLDDCHIDFDYTSHKNKQLFTNSRYDDRILLAKLAMDGLAYRYGKNNSKARERVEREIEIIDKLGFSSYFLIAWDIIRYSMSRGFHHVGRGSGANSIVAYCLKITDVDPIELNLYFERFLNPKRTSPPDFDIDYSWKERDEIQEYIFKRYGQKHTALLGATSTFKGRAAIRELGKVYGLPKEEVDSFLDNPGNGINQNEIIRHVLKYGRMMANFPNLRSIHAGGVLISEKPVTCYTALDLPPKGFPTTQWDMYVAESIGFEKFDILSQRGIGHIRESVEIIEKNRGLAVDIHQVKKFKEDPLVKNQLRNAETNGCFYIESPAMRGLLRKLKCDNYITLVAASSIIRPGVARSGMMKEYIRRFHNPQGFTFLHPVMKEKLAETYGVMVYQEDVIKICHHFAGLDLADADVLRRAMSGKYRSKKEFQRIVDKFFDNCNKRGYPVSLTKEVWRQIESFAGYSFSKAHSASYAVESFQSLYLKAHFPLEFMVSVINNFGGFYRTWVYFNEAKRCGGNIQLPCVNFSEYKTTIYGTDIYIGFIHLKNLDNKTGQLIVKERTLHGEFSGLEDFNNRIRVGLENLIILIRAGAFRFTGQTKAALLWEAHFLVNGKKKSDTRQQTLFSAPSRRFELPELTTSGLEDAYDEIELMGFPVSVSYFDLLSTGFRGEIRSRDLDNNAGKMVKMVGHLVTIKYVWTVKKEQMNFGTFVDEEGEFFDTIHFPVSLKKYPFRGSGVYLIYGKVVKEFGFPGIEVEKMAKLPLRPDPRFQ